MLLDTVGGAIEELARTRSAEALSLGGEAAAAKLAAALLALALVRPWGRRIGHRLLVGSNVLVSLTLLAWGSANVFAGTLVLAGVISPTSHPSEWVLRWHVFVWDLWFAVSGRSARDRDRGIPAGALRLGDRRRSPPVGSETGGALARETRPAWRR